jgi:hypothetical protein
MYQIDYNQNPSENPDHERYARCIEASKRIRWDIDQDVIQGREFNFSEHFLPVGISKIESMGFLSHAEMRSLSQIQGRTYANMFGLVERFINAKILELSRDHWFGDQTALEALIRFSDEELKHQELFRRIESMIADGMPQGYNFVPQPNEVAAVVLDKCTWSVLALTCAIELFTQSHYEQSMDRRPAARQAEDMMQQPKYSELYKSVFLHHWREESQHAVLDELEWRRADARMSNEERDQAVVNLIDLVAAVDGICTAQAQADTEYFFNICKRTFSPEQIEAVGVVMLKAYRWQYIISGVEHPRFASALGSMINDSQMQKIGTALAPIMA